MSKPLIYRLCFLMIGTAVGYMANLTSVVTSWSASNGDKALQAASGVDGESRKVPVEDSAVVAFAHGVQTASTKEEAYQVFEVMRNSFAGSWSAALAVKEFDEDLIHAGGVFGEAIVQSSWASPEKAKAWLWERGVEWRRDWIKEHLSRFPAEFAVAALEEAFTGEAFEGELYDESVMKRLLKKAWNSDGAALLKMLQEHSPETLSDVDYNDFDFTRLDVETTLESLPPHERSRFAQAYALDLAIEEHDLEKSMGWLKHHLNGKERDQALGGLIDGVVKKAPVQVVDMVREKGLSLSLSQQEGLVKYYSRLDFDAAHAWGESLPEGSEKVRIMASLGAQPWASDEEQTVASDYLLSNPNDPLFTEFAGELVDRSSNLEDAVSIMDSFPVGSLAAQKAVVAMMENFADYDPRSASEKLLSIPPENRSDPAIEHLINAIPDDVVGAFTWSLQVTSPEIRASLMAKYGPAVYENDPDQFNRIIESARLSESVMDIITKKE